MPTSTGRATRSPSATHHTAMRNSANGMVTMFMGVASTRSSLPMDQTSIVRKPIPSSASAVPRRRASNQPASRIQAELIAAIPNSGPHVLPSRCTGMASR